MCVVKFDPYSFCAFGVLNGFVIAAYILGRRPLTTGNLLLGTANLALSLRFFKAPIYYFNPNVSVTIAFRAEKPKYGGKTVAAAPDLIAELDQLMAETKLFTDPNLTLATVAKRMNQPKATLSQVINESMGVTFTTYLNRLRVEEAERKLRSSPDISVEELAEASGFSSQSTS
ncbi:MAG: AraC family transcriptional regulator [Pseudomonadota bacterium]